MTAPRLKIEGRYLRDENGYNVAVIQIADDEPRRPLIEAAPELLAALESILDLPTDDDGDRIIPPGFLDEARAAVGKAKGTPA